MLVAGAWAGGGLTGDVNAPNPCGRGALKNGFADQTIGAGAGCCWSASLRPWWRRRFGVVEGAGELIGASPRRLSSLQRGPQVTRPTSHRPRHVLLQQQHCQPSCIRIGCALG